MSPTSGLYWMGTTMESFTDPGNGWWWGWECSPGVMRLRRIEANGPNMWKLGMYYPPVWFSNWNCYLSGIFQPPLMSRKSSETDPQKLNVNRIISVISQVFCSCCVSSSLVLNIPILAQIWSIVDTVLWCSMHCAVFWLSVYNVCKTIRKHPFGNGL